ncbi:MAG TPA: TIGR03000 domain-containing protein [Pirellulales bacterium]|nr:TIGR03000 domain-containing protein [Pirellulales bacterium]
MLRRNLKKLMLGAAALTIAMAGGASQANAFWGHSHGGSSGGSYGSSGGSYGCWGSSGGYYGYASYGGSWGSYGGWASSGGCWGGRHHHHRHAYRAAYYGGSYGGWGSSGGSSGGSYGSYGSSGGAVIEGPAVMPQTPPPPPATHAPALESPTPAPGELPPEAPAAGDNTGFYRGARSATLSVHVPADAKVFVNGLATQSTGAERRYVSSGLQTGYNYTYEIRAELVRDGRPVSETKVIKVQAGGNADVDFELNGEQEEIAEQPVSTSLTLHVPADAKVFLSGNETKSFGETRRFSTTKLTGGQEWQDYVVRVELTRDGKTLTKEETVSLKAGDARELTVEFDAPQIAQTKVDRQ